MKILRSVFNSYMVNSYLLISNNNQAVLIDPAFGNEQEWNIMNAKIKELNLTLQKCLITHAHADHIMGAALLMKTYPQVELLLHKDGMNLYNSVNDYAMIMGFEKQTFPQPTGFLTDEETISVDNIKLQILHTPGHAHGSISIYFADENVVFTGDTLFRCSVGRTDLQGGSFEVLTNSIQQKLYTLPDETIVLPGHGDESQIAYEKHYNPFVTA